MFDAIETKLRWLERDLDVIAEPHGFSVEDARKAILHLQRDISLSEIPVDQFPTEFMKRCDEARGFGVMMIAVQAIDSCRGCMIYEPDKHALIIDQLCLSVRQHEFLKHSLVLREMWPELLSENRTKHASIAGARKHANDPRQQEKAFVRACWEAWRSDPSRYKKKIDFARDMIEKCEYLTSTKVIEDWCREWEKK